jgi:DNA-binding XRE family transcriptional regulator
MAQALMLLHGIRESRSNGAFDFARDAEDMLDALQKQGFELVAVATSTLSAQRVIGNRLQAARLLANLSRRELAARSGLHAATIHAIERGRQAPSDATRKKLDSILREQNPAAGIDTVAKPQPSPRARRRRISD